MQPINFPNATEIKKPPTMTDEECMSTFALIHENDKKEVVAFTQCWKPSYEDLKALNRGEGVFITIYYPRLPPISVFTMDENGQCNDL